MSKRRKGNAAGQAVARARKVLREASAHGVSNRRRQQLGETAAELRRLQAGGGRVTPKSQHSRRAR